MDFKPDMRSVFFQSLATNPKYSSAYEQSMNLFKQNSMITSDGKLNAQTQQKYNKALEVLNNGIEIERTNEQLYFDSILHDNKLPQDITAKLKNKLDTIFSSNGAFQYNQFINLINTILLGEEQYRAVLKLEKQRLNDLNSYAKVLERKAEKGKLKDWTNSKKENLGINNANDLDKFLYNEYLEKHSLKTFRGEFKNLNSTVDNIISKFIDSTITKILNSNASNKLLIQYYQNSSENNLSDMFIPQIINNIMLQLQNGNRISQLIEATINNNNSIITSLSKEITNNITENFETILINNQTSRFGKRGKKSKAVKEIEENKKIIYDLTGDNLGQEILDCENKLRDEGLAFIFNLDDPHSAVSEQLKEVKNQIQKGKDLADSNDNEIPEDQKKIIRNAKGQLSRLARQAFENNFKNKKDKIAQEYLLKISNALASNIIHISGPTYSEIVDSLKIQIISKGETFWSGPKNLKADTITITYDGIALSTDTLQTFVSEDELQQIMKENAHNFYNSFQSHLPKSGEATSLSQGYLGWMTATSEAIQKLNEKVEEQNLDREKKLEALKEIANIMKNTIIVTETMKTFDTYYNKIGFVSGSLGPNIGQQILNFQTLFESAGVGMTDTEATWLETAIVNCADAALGTANKDPIEKYLSTLAGFAVFDEGSAELAIISKTASDFLLENSPKLLHLYKLNGLYFPGSYILSRIYENLSKTINQIQTECVNNDGVHIRANATESLIPKKEHDLATRWSTTYNKAKEVTFVDISFLSGLFNIVDQLITSFANNF